LDSSLRPGKGRARRAIGGITIYDFWRSVTLPLKVALQLPKEVDAWLRHLFNFKGQPMTTAKKSDSGKTTSSARRGSGAAKSSDAGPNNAIRLLTSDHREVKALFQQYQELVDHDGEEDEKQALAEQICAMLTVHAQIEEEIFYPAAQAGIKEPDLVDEATVEHASAKDLIAQIQSAELADPLYDAKVKVLGEYIDHHVKEEEGELFPQARKAKLDLDALGEEMANRKHELMSEFGLTSDEGEEAVA
jgi:hemerythrin superfamily protein